MGENKLYTPGDDNLRLEESELQLQLEKNETFMSEDEERLDAGLYTWRMKDIDPNKWVQVNGSELFNLNKYKKFISGIDPSGNEFDNISVDEDAHTSDYGIDVDNDGNFTIVLKNKDPSSEENEFYDKMTTNFREMDINQWNENDNYEEEEQEEEEQEIITLNDYELPAAAEEVLDDSYLYNQLCHFCIEGKNIEYDKNNNYFRIFCQSCCLKLFNYMKNNRTHQCDGGRPDCQQFRFVNPIGISRLCGNCHKARQNQGYRRW